MQEHGRDAAVLPVSVAQHRHKGRDSRSSRNETERTAHGDAPYEVAADRPSQFELVGLPKLIDEIWRNLAVLHSLHRQSDQSILRGRGDRITTLRLVAILAREPNIHMLARQVSLPSGDCEKKTFDARRFKYDLTHFGSPPLKSPH